MESKFEGLSPSEKIINILKNHEDFKGHQPAMDLAKFLNMKRRNVDSLLSRMYKKSILNRVDPAKYIYSDNPHSQISQNSFRDEPNKIGLELLDESYD